MKVPTSFSRGSTFAGALLCAISVLLLSSCTTVMPTAKQPKDGPRARVRLASFAGELTVDVVQADGKKGTLYTRSGFYPGSSNLGMPKGSSGWPGHNEYYVVGNQMVFAHSEITRVPSGLAKFQSHCEVSGYVWLEAGKDYEIGVVTGQGSQGWDMSSCFITAMELVPAPQGEAIVKPAPVLPASPRRG